MDGPHGSHTPIGYPERLAERAAAAGLALEFSNVYVATNETLPQTPAALNRHLRLSGVPDVVIVQVGSMYAYRSILSMSRRTVVTRERIGRAAGRLLLPGYAVVHPATRWLGHPRAAYAHSGDLRSFLDLVQRNWPQAAVLLLQPHRPTRDGVFDPAVTETVRAELEEVASEHGIAMLDPDVVVGTDQGLRCANAMNLNSPGSRLVGDLVADHVLPGFTRGGRLEADRGIEALAGASKRDQVEAQVAQAPAQASA